MFQGDEQPIVGLTSGPSTALPSRVPPVPATLPPREINRIRGLLGTAVNVQSMVYGNLNDNSGTGLRGCVSGERAEAAAGCLDGCVHHKRAAARPRALTSPTPHPLAGVCFTRNPATGTKQLYGEYLPNAQGEDVVAGIRTPLDVAHVSARCRGCSPEAAAAAWQSSVWGGAGQPAPIPLGV